MRVALAFSYGALLAAAPVVAQDEPTVADSAAVDATIAALEQGDAVEFGWLVSQVETLRFIEKPFATPSEAFSGLRGCEAKETGRKSFNTILTYNFEWECENETWVGSIMPDEIGKSVALVDLLPKARADAAVNRPRPTVPPPPPMISRRPMTEEQRLADQVRREKFRAVQVERSTAMAEAIVAGDVSQVAPTISSDARISFSFHNPFLRQPFIEKRGVGEEAFADQATYMYSELGQPSSANCSGESYPIVCKWAYPASGTTLMAFITANGAEDVARPIFSIDFRYATAKKLKEAQERAGS